MWQHRRGTRLAARRAAGQPGSRAVRRPGSRAAGWNATSPQTARPSLTWPPSLQGALFVLPDPWSSPYLWRCPIPAKAWDPPETQPLEVHGMTNLGTELGCAEVLWGETNCGLPLDVGISPLMEEVPSQFSPVVGDSLLGDCIDH